MTSRNDFDRCFEAALLGDRQAIILHKFHIGDDVYHVCTLDSNDFYDSAYYQLDRETNTFARLADPPIQRPQC